MLKKAWTFFIFAVVFLTPASGAFEGSVVQTIGSIRYEAYTYTRPPIPSDTYGAWRTKDQRIELWKDLWNVHGLSNRILKLGTSVQGRDILMFDCGNVSSNVMLIDAELHGNEDHPGEVLLMFVYWLFESGDSIAQRILQKNRLMFVPSVDIDKFERVNARAGGGVNLNRNFEYGWGQSGDNQPGSDDYRGPSAGSEPETQAIRKAFIEYQPIVYVSSCRCVHGPGLWKLNSGKRDSWPGYIL